MNAKQAHLNDTAAEVPQSEIDSRVDQLIRRTLDRNIPGLANLPQSESELELSLIHI